MECPGAAEKEAEGLIEAVGIMLPNVLGHVFIFGLDRQGKQKGQKAETSLSVASV